MEQEDLGEGFQKRKAKPRLNPWLRSASDEELHQRHSLGKSTQDGEDCRGWLIVDALVQCINRDDA